jgi:hypothetical protein
MTQRVGVLLGILAMALTPAARATAAPSGNSVERTWVAVSGAPQQRGAMAYDSHRDQTLLLVPGNPSQTWTFSGATQQWTRRFPATSPSLNGASVAYDAAHQVVVAFGSDASSDNCDPDSPGATWIWNGTTWRQVHPSVGPDECSGVSGGGMAYDAVRHRVVYIASTDFGGTTWLWNGATWQDAGGGPNDAGIAYDPVSQRVIAFGSYVFFHGPNADGSTRAWTGSKWIQLAAGGGRYDPAPRGNASIAYDDTVGGLVMFGGFTQHFDGSVHKFADTWRWVGTHWVQMGTETSPGGMAGAAFVHDAHHHLGVLFGGGGKAWLFTAARAGGGYFLAEANGAVIGVGDARNVGDARTVRLNHPIVGIARTPTRKGYWLTASDGGIFAYGDAHFYGSTGGIRLNQPIVGIAATPSGRGYWLVARDGGIFTFGDARYRGSTGGIRLNQPIVGMAATPTGDGYWLVARDGGVFTFGDAHFYGSAGNRRVSERITAIAATPRGDGYWLVGVFGSVYSFGHVRYAGGSQAWGVVAISSSPTGNGYTMFDDRGDAYNYGDATYHGGAPGAAVVSAVTT